MPYTAAVGSDGRAWSSAVGSSSQRTPRAGKRRCASSPPSGRPSKSASDTPTVQRQAPSSSSSRTLSRQDSCSHERVPRADGVFFLFFVCLGYSPTFFVVSFLPTLAVVQRSDSSPLKGYSIRGMSPPIGLCATTRLRDTPLNASQCIHASLSGGTICIVIRII